ncbi:ADP-ribosylglycohydrolase family protein [Bremerella sp. JC817]|uniref:ADP-ribosylglycohydrolase family protein n=1 Tax=Bremerella sp. JC817 TaxID=3231756 RepID=UPI003458ECD9
MAKLSRSQRIAGCLLTGALGDAIAAPYETSPPGQSLVAGKQLRTTDDTQLTLATCEAIVARSAVDPAAIAQAMLHWFQAGRIRGIGSSTLKSMRDLTVGVHWADAGSTGERSAGNGAAMRIAPLAFLLDPDEAAQRTLIRDICWITHHNDEAYIGALAIVYAIRMVTAEDADEPDLITKITERLPDSNVRDRLGEVANGVSYLDYAQAHLPTGYVVDSVPAAILAATQYADPLVMFRDIVTGGGDVDTVASMAGQILGAEQGIMPSVAELLPTVDLYEEIKTIAARFGESRLDSAD